MSVGTSVGVSVDAFVDVPAGVGVIVAVGVTSARIVGDVGVTGGVGLGFIASAAAPAKSRHKNRTMGGTQRGIRPLLTTSPPRVAVGVA